MAGKDLFDEAAPGTGHPHDEHGQGRVATAVAGMSPPGGRKLGDQDIDRGLVLVPIECGPGKFVDRLEMAKCSVVLPQIVEGLAQREAGLTAV